MAGVIGLIQRLPPGTVWAVTLTHDVDESNCVAFNIWVDCLADRLYLRRELSLPNPTWESDSAEEHEHYTPFLTLSIIQGDLS